MPTYLLVLIGLVLLVDSVTGGNLLILRGLKREPSLTIARFSQAIFGAAAIVYAIVRAMQ